MLFKTYGIKQTNKMMGEKINVVGTSASKNSLTVGTETITLNMNQ